MSKAIAAVALLMVSGLTAEACGGSGAGRLLGRFRHRAATALMVPQAPPVQYVVPQSIPQPMPQQAPPPVEGKKKVTTTTTVTETTCAPRATVGYATYSYAVPVRTVPVYTARVYAAPAFAVAPRAGFNRTVTRSFGVGGGSCPGGNCPAR